MIFNSGTRAKVREAEPLWVGKFVLRILCFLASIVALCVAGYSFSLSTLLHSSAGTVIYTRTRHPIRTLRTLTPR